MKKTPQNAVCSHPLAHESEIVVDFRALDVFLDFVSDFEDYVESVIQVSGSSSSEPPKMSALERHFEPICSWLRSLAVGPYQIDKVNVFEQNLRIMLSLKADQIATRSSEAKFYNAIVSLRHTLLEIGREIFN